MQHDPEMINLFNAMVDEMFDYGKHILLKREKILKMIF